MDGLTLLSEAGAAGLTVLAAGDRLVIRGAKSADAVARQLLAHKAVVLAALSRKPHVAHNSGHVEWYTPAEYIDAARQVMGTIDLDPASSEEANRVVGAERFYTKADNGLVRPWRGNVWMNPPFKAALIARFVDKLCQHVAMGDVVQATILTNNATETRWYSRLTAVSSALCMVRGRIKFWSPDRRVSAPLQGQHIFYVGPNWARFHAVFAQFGVTVPLTPLSADTTPANPERIGTCVDAGPCPWDEATEPGPACAVCGSLEEWIDLLGGRHCTVCEADTLDKALRLADRAARLRKQARMREPAHLGSHGRVPGGVVDIPDLGNNRPQQRPLEGFVRV